MSGPSWNDFRDSPVPGWLRDAKFGIYTHWGLYSVPACGPNASWYAYNMYREGSLQNYHHRLRYGKPEDFGYKDFAPLFTAERFDPEEWAELFRDAGARFAGPVAEHHDGFSLWDTRHSAWNAKLRGPRRDVVGELAAAIRGRGLKFMTAMHHAENWWFYPHWKKRYDVSDPAYQDLYGPPHDADGEGDPALADPNPYVLDHHAAWPRQERPSKAFLDRWLAKLEELVDKYSPDLMWFDFGLKWVQESYKLDFLAYFREACAREGREGAVTYKWHDLAPGAGVEDIEQGSRAELAHNFWVTDTTIDAGEAWGYVEGAAYKSPTTLIHYLADNVSKNGALLLNVGPKADGAIPDEAREILREVGRWLEVNGEAIYGTVPWIRHGEGPARAAPGGAFGEAAMPDYSARDLRYTVAGDRLYAIFLGLPRGEAVLKTLGEFLYPSEIASVSALGVEGELPWKLDRGGLRVLMPEAFPRGHAAVLRIRRRRPFGEGRP